MQGLIQAVSDRCLTTGSAKFGDKLQLGCGRSATLCFQLESEYPAVVKQDQVRHSGANTEAVEDCGLNRAAPAAVRRVPPKNAMRATLTEVLADGALNGLFGVSTARSLSMLYGAARAVALSVNFPRLRCRPIRPAKTEAKIPVGR